MCKMKNKIITLLKNGENIAVFDVRTKITDSNIEKIIKIKTLKLLNN